MTRSKECADPFAVLGIAATLDGPTIKRAYFAALARHPPHADPEGFRRLRDAYEALSGPRLLPTWVATPLDIDGELREVDLELGPKLADATTQRRALRVRAARVAAFEALLRLDLGAVRARLGCADASTHDAADDRRRRPLDRDRR